MSPEDFLVLCSSHLSLSLFVTPNDCAVITLEKATLDVDHGLEEATPP